MSGMDEVEFNTRERPLSADWNDVQAFAARSVLDMVGYMMQRKDHAAGSGNVSGTDRDVVMGGLEATPSGSDVDVHPGVLVQHSTTLSPTPATKDSDWRFAAIRATQTLTAPSPGSNTYYLLEAQLNETTSSESRDILDSTTGSFSPQSVVKQRTKSITFQFRAGSATAAPVPQADWVPIAVVFRSAGGGSVAVEDIHDVRPLWADVAVTDAGLPPKEHKAEITIRSTPTSPSNNVDVEASVTIDGRHMMCSLSNIDLSNAAFLDTNVSLSADTWYYLYLVPWDQQYLPKAVHNEGASSGVVVLSSDAPSQGTRFTSSGNNIGLPEPWGNGSSFFSEGWCIGALRRNGSNNGWAAAWSDSLGARVRTHHPDNTYQVFSTGSSPSQTTSLTIPAPATARAAILHVRCGSVSSANTIFILNTGQTSPGEELAYITVPTDGVSAYVEVPVVGPGSTSLDLHFAVGAALPSSLNVHLAGWAQ